MLKTLILFNGPPNSGKDAGASLYLNFYNQTHQTQIKFATVKLAEPVRQAAIGTFPNLNPDNFDSQKSLPILNNQVTLRDFMINFSEKLMKPMFGQNVFAMLAGQQISKLFETHDCVLVTDLGFDFEVDGIMDNISSEYQVDVIIIQIFRPETSYQNDSRKYVKVNYPIYQIDNDMGLQEYQDKLFAIPI